LDVCCLNRPFDDQAQERIRREADAVVRVLARLQRPDTTWIGSDMIDREVEQTPDAQRRAALRRLARATATRVSFDEAVEGRARQLESLGIRAADALHIACAEHGGAEVFLTVDQRLLRRAARIADQLRVQVRNPRDWIEEQEAGAS
jgi:predicted nucleic acid-binding protein